MKKLDASRKQFNFLMYFQDGTPGLYSPLPKIDLAQRSIVGLGSMTVIPFFSQSLVTPRLFRSKRITFKHLSGLLDRKYSRNCLNCSILLSFAAVYTVYSLKISQRFKAFYCSLFPGASRCMSDYLVGFVNGLYS